MGLVLVSFTAACALLYRYMRHSTIDLSLLHLKRASETQNHLPRVPKHQGTDFRVYETCACVIHTNLHTLSATCALVLSYIR